MISAQIVAHSSCPKGHELISVLATFPRIILAEVNTHRMLSKNTASSRAIPFNKMVQSVEDNPFIPIAWQKEHTGMQGTDYHDEITSDKLKLNWLAARDEAIECAKSINALGGTKQLANRLLEPFMWTTMLITGPKEDGGWDNFFNLRCPKYILPLAASVDMRFNSWKDVVKHAGEISSKNPDNIDRIKTIEFVENFSILDRLKQNQGAAEIHMMQLAECIWNAINESNPVQLEAGDWHIPFKYNINNDTIRPFLFQNHETSTEINEIKVKISTGMAARTSYTVIDKEQDINISNLIKLHDRLITQNPPHSSPMEHCAKVMTHHEYITNHKGLICEIETSKGKNCVVDVKYAGWCRNFRGFIPYRHIIETNGN